MLHLPAIRHGFLADNSLVYRPLLSCRAPIFFSHLHPLATVSKPWHRTNLSNLSVSLLQYAAIIAKNSLDVLPPVDRTVSVNYFFSSHSCVTDYVGFIKRMLKQLQSDHYPSLRRVDLDIIPLEPSSQEAFVPVLLVTVSSFSASSLVISHVPAHTPAHTLCVT
ncbi:unnamed protein product [Dibothriocephalus latus]|uniref:Uncharacterized protein n=1 Tax=Dibothriocephalus latus TaxID=60516 RepID=A0A3P6Q5Z9_DIBLA|nr:unnamed protein product [Dibothriocephalus latus]